MTSEAEHTEQKTYCEHCFRSLWMGGSCKRRDCPRYARIYLGDQARVLRANVAAWAGKTCMVTLTAPGADQLPWDLSKCRPGEHKCSGKRGCRVEYFAAANWNRDVTKRLGTLLRAARESVRDDRAITGKVTVLGYVCEVQDRGVFHPHVVLGYRTADDRVALDRYRKTLRRRRGAHGFGRGRAGFDAGKPDRFNALDSGRYIAKYLRPDRAKSSFVPALQAVESLTPRNPQTGRRTAVIRPVYVSKVLTGRTGVTVSYLRFRRWVWRVWGEVEESEILLAWEIRQSFGGGPIAAGEIPPPRAGPLESARAQLADTLGYLRDQRDARQLVATPQLAWPF